jgi:Family of unknown function (DUF5641)
MLGRATIEAPQMDFHNAYNLTRRLQFVDEVNREFWHKWHAFVFQGLDRSYKWRQSHRDSLVGDVVLLKDETAASNTYKLARLTEVFRDEKDGRVRKVSVASKYVNEKVFRVSTRPIHKIVLVVPAGDADLPALPPPAGLQPPPGGPPVDQAALLPPAGPAASCRPPCGSGGPAASCWPSRLLAAPMWIRRLLPVLPAQPPPGAPPVDQAALLPPAGLLPAQPPPGDPPPCGSGSPAASFQPSAGPPASWRPPVDQAALPPPAGLLAAPLWSHLLLMKPLMKQQGTI